MIGHSGIGRTRAVTGRFVLRPALPPAQRGLPAHTAMAAVFTSPTRSVVLGTGSNATRTASSVGMCQKPLLTSSHEAHVSGWEGEQRQWA